MVEKCVVLESVEPMILSPPELATSCFSLYSPVILYTPPAGWILRFLILPSCICSVNVEYSISGEADLLSPKRK